MTKAKKSIKDRSSLSNLKPGDVVWDTVIRGLHIRVSSTGIATWYLSFYWRGISRRPRLSKVPYPTLGLAEARGEAKKRLLQIEAGEDPFAPPARAHITVAEVLDMALEARKKAGKKPEIIGYPFIVATIGNRDVASLTKDDTKGLYARISARKCPGQKQGPPAKAMAVRTLTELRSALRQGAREDWFSCKLPDNLFDFTRDAIYRRKRKATAEELQRIYRELQEEAKVRPGASVLIQALLLTGARVGELRKAKREWVDSDGILTLKEHKTAHAIGDKRIALPKQVLAMADTIPNRGPYLFGDIQHRRLGVYWKNICKRAGCEDMQLRDLRRTAATMAIAWGVSLTELMEAFGHTNPLTTKGYVQAYDGLKQDVAEKLAAKMRMMMEGEKKDEKDEKYP